MNILKYKPVADATDEPEVEHRIEQLVRLAKALATEIETLRAELSTDNDRASIENSGIDFYDKVEQYEIELINKALHQSGGNQAKAAKLLHLKSTTLHAKMKHYGLNPVRPMLNERLNRG